MRNGKPLISTDYADTIIQEVVNGQLDSLIWTRKETDPSMVVAKVYIDEDTVTRLDGAWSGVVDMPDNRLGIWNYFGDVDTLILYMHAR